MDGHNSATNQGTKTLIRTALLEILGGSTGELGFVDTPRARTIYIGQNYGGTNWYLWNPDAGKGKEPEPIEADALRCKLKNLRLRTKTSDRYDDSVKLRIDVEADQPYSIETGVDTVFAKGFLSSVIAAGAGVMEGTLTIETRASDQVDKVVFCNLYVDGQRFRAPYDKTTSGEELYQIACDELGIEATEYNPNDGDSNSSTRGSAPQLPNVNSARRARAGA